jgi:putative hydrolase of the HAD superfamily
MFRQSHALTNPVAAVTFDVGGTLLTPHPNVGEIYQEVLKNHGVHAESAHLNSRFSEAWKILGKTADCKTNDLREIEKWRRVVRETFRFLDTEFKFDQIFSELWETFTLPHRWQLRDDSRKTITAIRQRGFRTAVLSNWDSRLRPLLKGFGLLGSFDHLFISSEIGWEKPDPRIFRTAEEQLGLPPEQILHVGDSPEQDLAPALAAGWRCVLISDEANSATETGVTLRNLEPLLDLRLAT